MKDKLVLNMVRDETGLQFFLLKHKVDWNGRYETPAGKAWHGRRLPPARGKRVPEVEINVPILQTHKKSCRQTNII
ncbi:hypothetical protein [Peribacillus frigoritolerans]|uniref:hypothetical protein n=1 Tax=Peribacillus frigoritolerans TaxID=450367 RepID=UPI00222EE51A|nr:hypothetical protein [Peribacillus frigoritolerans]MDM5312215.1 hypothetical protein [Peribacillus frigoritolerans]UZD46393.1 hypothetical protein OMJ04_22885 [Peribacillus frigoritolerans]WHX61444.1 hypothetical protein QNH33_23045 [Peribacillus frigoritolerans]